MSLLQLQLENFWVKITKYLLKNSKKSDLLPWVNNKADPKQHEEHSKKKGTLNTLHDISFY